MPAETLGWFGTEASDSRCLISCMVGLLDINLFMGPAVFDLEILLLMGLILSWNEVQGKVWCWSGWPVKAWRWLKGIQHQSRFSYERWKDIDQNKIVVFQITILFVKQAYKHDCRLRGNVFLFWAESIEWFANEIECTYILFAGFVLGPMALPRR